MAYIPNGANAGLESRKPMGASKEAENLLEGG